MQSLSSPSAAEDSKMPVWRRFVRSCVLLVVIGCSGASEQSRPSNLSIAPRGVTIGHADAIGFRAKGFYEDGSSRNLTGVMWESSAPAVATSPTMHLTG
jgi:hypothetical protein